MAIALDMGSADFEQRFSALLAAKRESAADVDAAVATIIEDVRLRGEALNPERRGIRATFIYTGIDLPSGYHFVGYEAGGPKTGPITVAVVKSKAGDAEDDELYPDVKKLVRRNGGV